MPDELKDLGRLATPRVVAAIANAGSSNETPDDDAANELASELKQLMDGHDPSTIATALISATNDSLQHHPEDLARLVSWLGTILDSELLGRELRNG